MKSVTEPQLASVLAQLLLPRDGISPTINSLGYFQLEIHL